MMFRVNGISCVANTTLNYECVRCSCWIKLAYWACNDYGKAQYINMRNENFVEKRKEENWQWQKLYDEQNEWNEKKQQKNNETVCKTPCSKCRKKNANNHKKNPFRTCSILADEKVFVLLCSLWAGVRENKREIIVLYFIYIYCIRDTISLVC